MAIEWLTHNVPVGLRDRFIQVDEEIWTAFLATCPGFIRKHVWVHPEEPDRVFSIVEWETRALWKAIDPAALAETERRFVAELGVVCPIIYSTEYTPVLVGKLMP
jgi:uncharacterized protein (TIGR03792 family)